jgi:hypothetical protein
MIRLLAMLMTVPAAAQTVTNNSAYDYAGWQRVPTDWSAPHYMGWSMDMATLYVAAEDGLDVWVRIAAGQSRPLALASAAPWTRPLAQWADLNSLYMGLPLVNGQPMQLRTAHPSGAGWLLKWGAMFDTYWYAGMSCVWYPDQPQLIKATASVYVSSPSVVNQSPPVAIGWGDSWVSSPVLLPAGTLMSSGQVYRSSLTFTNYRLASQLGSGPVLADGMVTIDGL